MKEDFEIVRAKVRDHMAVYAKEYKLYELGIYDVFKTKTAIKQSLDLAGFRHLKNSTYSNKWEAK